MFFKGVVSQSVCRSGSHRVCVVVGRGRAGLSDTGGQIGVTAVVSHPVAHGTSSDTRTPASFY